MRRIWLLGVLAAPILLAACGSEPMSCGSAGGGPAGSVLSCTPTTEESAEAETEGDTGVSSTSSGDELWGRAFAAHSVTGSDADRDLMAGVEFTVTFAEGSVGAYASCNRMGADVEIQDGSLNVGDVIATQMACEEPAMAIDAWIVSFLEAGPDYTLDGDTLTLATDEVTVEMTETDADAAATR